MREALRNITARTQADGSFKVKYQWPLAGREKFEISPDTHNRGKPACRTSATARFS
jgi:hypothetical protein